VGKVTVNSDADKVLSNNFFQKDNGHNDNFFKNYAQEA
jgi:hypothetical protein